MSDYVNEALLGASPYKKQADESKALVSKWDKTGLLEGLNNDFQKSGMATMLENQARQLISENSGTGGTAGGSTSGASSEEWSGVALPLVRRIFGEIAAQDFVSVQPMNLPSGLVFYLDFKYGKTAVSTNAEGFGTQNSGVNVPGGDVSSLGGTTGPNSPVGSSAPYGIGGLYGEGRYDYSINATSSLFTADPDNSGPVAGTYASSSATYKDINFNQEFSSSLGAGELIKLQVPRLGFSAEADFKAVRSWNVSGSADDVHSMLPQFTEDDGTDVTFIMSCSSIAAFGASTSGQKFDFIFSKQPTESVRGDFEDTVGSATDDTLAIPEVDLQLKSQAIVC